MYDNVIEMNKTQLKKINDYDTNIWKAEMNTKKKQKYTDYTNPM